MELLAPVKESIPENNSPTPTPSKSQPDIVGDDVESIIRSIFEIDGNSNKSNYLGYRASGFKQREALRLTGIHEKTLHRWRDADPEFVRLENALPSLRKDLGVNFAHLEFLRNYRLILQKDFEVIQKSLKKPDPKDPSTFMSKSDTDYLLRMRGQYTPQQLEVMGALVGAASSSDTKALDFTKLIMSISQTKNEIRLEGSK